MKFSEINEYVQTIAALGAIVALLAVGFEIRQSKRIATQQAVSNNWTNWIEATSSDLESGISRIRAKSMLKPDELTLEEKIDPESWLQNVGYI